MRPLVRSAARVWTKRPAGPLLLALGILIATVLAASASLALDGAREAEEREDREALGERMARVRTPGGYTVAEDAIRDLQAQLATARGVDAAASVPVYLERDALVTTQAGTQAGWTVLGLTDETLAAMDLAVPGGGQALVDPGARSLPGSQTVTVRMQRPPTEDVHLHQTRNGQLERTVLVGGEYMHADGDEYTFEVPIDGAARQVSFTLTTSDNDTDFDLETVDPEGTQRLDDAGTPAQPVMPNVTVEGPVGGNWTVRVHAKVANEVPFRLEVDEVFEARDAQTLGRLLAGEGFRAVGAQLGLSEQAELDLALEPTDLDELGPGRDGLIVLPLDRLQSALTLEGRVDGVLVMATSAEAPLEGLDPAALGTIRATVQDARDAAQDRRDPISGLEVDDEANQRRQARDARLDSTRELLFVVLPAGVVAGILLATWAAGLHTRRMAPELRVMAGLGQSRASSWGLVVAHLGPPLVLGFLGALAMAPLVGAAIARGIGLDATPVLFPDATGLIVPVAALVPIGATAWLSLGDAVEGQDPRAQDRPPTRRTRWLATGTWTILFALLAGGYLLTGAGPADAYLLAALTGCAGGLALVWAPSLEPLLRRTRSLSVPSLGLFRTRSTHPQLALATATATLVLAAMLAGTALSQAATPDAQVESGGYPVVAETPRFTTSLGELAPDQGPQAEQATQLLRDSLGIELMMRVTGTGIHSVDTGSEQTVYGIDTSFAQRHRHQVQALGGEQDPFRAVATSDDKVVVSRDVFQAAEGLTLFLNGPQGRLSYEIVGVVETRLFEGVYVSQDALPVHYTQIGGQQRFLLGDETDHAAYAAGLRDVFKEDGMRASTSQALVEAELSGQRRAGTTLQALAGLGLVTALLLVVLLGLRARAERRTSDAVLVAMGARTRALATGIAVETALPIVVGVLLGGAVLLPAAGALDGLEGLAFPLLPIDEGSLLVATLVLLAAMLAVTLVVAAVVGYRAVEGLDQKALRELG